MKEENTLKTIMNKLSENKTELATHKVEFALVDDIKKIRESFMKNMGESNKGFNKVRDAAMDLNSITSKIEKNTKDANTLMQKIKSISKELGISINEIDGADLLENIAEGTAVKSLKSRISKIIKINKK